MNVYAALGRSQAHVRVCSRANSLYDHRIAYSFVSFGFLLTRKHGFQNSSKPYSSRKIQGHCCNNTHVTRTSERSHMNTFQRPQQHCSTRQIMSIHKHAHVQHTTGAAHWLQRRSLDSYVLHGWRLFEEEPGSGLRGCVHHDLVNHVLCHVTLVTRVTRCLISSTVDTCVRGWTCLLTIKT